MSTIRGAALAMVLLCGAAVAPAAEPLRIAVSIPPQAWLAEALAGDDIAVTVVLPPGASPATFEPTARQLAEVGRATVYFAIGVPLENALLPVLRANFPELAIIEAPAGAAHDHAHGHGHDHAHEGLDPHLWVDPLQVLELARSMAPELAGRHPSIRDGGAERLRLLEETIGKLDGELREILGAYRGRSFYVFHPAWGHFAERYGLTQIAIERGGGLPATRSLAHTMKAIGDSEAGAIFCQPQFDTTQVEALAAALDIPVVTLDPLARDWAENLREVAGRIATTLAPGAPETTGDE